MTIKGLKEDYTANQPVQMEERQFAGKSAPHLVYYT